MLPVTKKVTNYSGLEQMHIAKNTGKFIPHIVSNNISIIWTVGTHWDHPRATPLQQRTGLLLNKLNLQNNVCDYYHHQHIHWSPEFWTNWSEKKFDVHNRFLTNYWSEQPEHYRNYKFGSILFGSFLFASGQFAKHLLGWPWLD